MKKFFLVLVFLSLTIVVYATNGNLLSNPWFCYDLIPGSPCPHGAFWRTDSGFYTTSDSTIPGDDNTAAILIPQKSVDFANVWQWGIAPAKGNQANISFYYRCVAGDEMKLLLRGTNDPGTQIWAGDELGAIWSCNENTGWQHAEISKLLPQPYDHVRVEFYSNGLGSMVTGIELEIEQVTFPVFLPLIAN